MGPIALFDKSFLQSLSVDEAVWFDHFFLAVVCPVFYVETLADLAKARTERGHPDDVVRNIAEKFPEMGGSPCKVHVDLCIGDLLGHHIPVDGRVPRSGGRLVKSGTVYDQTPEEEAFRRWGQGRFHDVERLAAAYWRRQLSGLDLHGVAEILRQLGISGKNCRTLEDVRDIARSVVVGTDKPFDRLKLGILFFDVPQHLHSSIIQAWEAAGQLPLATYAPYAAFVLTIEIFFQLALAANLISTERPSNRTDISYLFYLPFSMVFVSNDNLHRRCASLFLRSDQEFVWGPDLKAGLKAINQHFLKLPEAEREKGLLTRRDDPPVGSIVAHIWNRHMRSDHRGQENVKLDSTEREKLVERLKAFREQAPIGPNGTPDGEETLSIERHVHRRRGSWWQMPKNYREEQK